jgi:hypothetical protein
LVTQLLRTRCWHPLHAREKRSRVVIIPSQHFILLCFCQSVELLHYGAACVISGAVTPSDHGFSVQREWLLHGLLGQGCFVIPLSSGHSPWLCSSLSLGLLEFHLATKRQQAVTSLGLTKRGGGRLLNNRPRTRN